MTRRWFQIHLSTAVLLMIFASVLMWLNFRTTITPIPYSKTLIELKPEWKGRFYYSEWERGWPYTMNRGSEGSATVLFTGSNKIWRVRDTWIEQPSRPRGFEGDWYLNPMVWNALIFLGILLVVAVIVEFIVRRREVRKK